MTGQEPFAQISSVEKLVQFVCVEQQRPPLLQGWGRALSTLLSRAWHPQAEQRPSFEEIASLMHTVLIERCEASLFFFSFL